MVVQVCDAAAPPPKKLLKLVPPPNGQVAAPAGHNRIWSWLNTPAPIYSGSLLKMVSSSTLPSPERHAVPVEMATTLEAVFAKPDHGLQSPAVGNEKPLPMKLVPPLPKPCPCWTVCPKKAP